MRGIARLVLVTLALALAIATAAAAADVSDVYRERCAVCHGTTGRGDGPAAGLLSPRPRDFTSGRYKFRSTPTGTLPLPYDVIRSIRGGLPGTSMPAYEGLLPAETIEALARYVLALAPPDAVPGVPQPIDLFRRSDVPGSVLYERAGCAACHGTDGRGGDWRMPPAAPTERAPGASSAPTDLTEPWTFRGGSGVGAIALRILTGIDASPMPSHAGTLGAADAIAIATHVARLARKPIWSETDPALIARAGVATAPVERGRYLVNAMMCPLCHTPVGPDDGAYDTTKFLAGGMRVSAYPWGVWYSRNLTGDPETGLGRWSEAEIVRALTEGVARDGRRLDPMAMPWPWFSRLTGSDARAIAAYLKSLPGNPNPVPAPEPIALPERMGGKLLALLGSRVALELWGGNAAADPELRGVVPAPRARRLAARAIGWSTLVVAMALLAAGAWMRRRAAVVTAGIVLAGWLTLAVWPPLALVSPGMVSRWLLRGMPRLPATLTGAERARAERGEYLATIAPCGLCHTPARVFAGVLTGRTAAGGMEARWKIYGTAVSSNLTPHPADGIGSLSDAALVRAMRSGIGHDGRALHWQAMPWDVISNWSLEDQRAMIGYLRVLPPVAGKAPPPRPPREGDPLADAFSFGDAVAR